MPGFPVPATTSRAQIIAYVYRKQGGQTPSRNHEEVP
jgi:hypothetical protein